MTKVKIPGPDPGGRSSGPPGRSRRLARLDQNGDGLIGAAERADIKASLEKRAMEAAQ